MKKYEKWQLQEYLNLGQGYFMSTSVPISSLEALLEERDALREENENLKKENDILYADRNLYCKLADERMAEVHRLKEENNQWKELHERSATMVIPSETDSADAYRQMWFEMKEALEEICKPTYGTELCNTDEENNEILAAYYSIYLNIARKALGGQK